MSGYERKHPIAAALTILSVLVAALAVAVQYGYLSSATLLALTPTELGAFAFLGFVAAVCVYAAEDRA